MNVPLDSPETLMNYIGSLHGYLHHSRLLFEAKTLDEASVKVFHIERMEKHEEDDLLKRTTTTKKKEENPSCNHCEKEWHNEEPC